MSDPMRVRATESGGVVDVKILMSITKAENAPTKQLRPS